MVTQGLPNWDDSTGFIVDSHPMLNVSARRLLSRISKASPKEIPLPTIKAAVSHGLLEGEPLAIYERARGLANTPKAEIPQFCKDSGWSGKQIRALAGLVQRSWNSEAPLAVWLLEAAAARGDVEAIVKTAVQQLSRPAGSDSAAVDNEAGSDGNELRKEALKTLTRLAEEGNVDAILALADEAWRSGDKDKNIELLRLADSKGSVQGALGLGRACVACGLWDEAKAAFTRAADAGHESGFLNLATLESSEANKLSLMRAAAAKGSVLAAHNMGAIYAEKGMTEMAMEWFSVSAEQGFAPSRLNLDLLRAHTRRSKSVPEREGKPGFNG